MHKNIYNYQPIQPIQTNELLNKPAQYTQRVTNVYEPSLALRTKMVVTNIIFDEGYFSRHEYK